MHLEETSAAAAPRGGHASIWGEPPKKNGWDWAGKGKQKRPLLTARATLMATKGESRAPVPTWRRERAGLPERHKIKLPFVTKQTFDLFRPEIYTPCTTLSSGF